MNLGQARIASEKYRRAVSKGSYLIAFYMISLPMYIWLRKNQVPVLQLHLRIQPRFFVFFFVERFL